MKKLTLILLTTLISISLLPATVFAATFKDVPSSHWAYSQISEMSQRGVINGYPDGNFYPENTVTRAEFAKIMTVAAGLPISDYSIYFDDVKQGAWYIPYINAAKYYLNGFNVEFIGEEGIYYFFEPNQAAVREDIAVALVKLKGYANAFEDDDFGVIASEKEAMLETMFTDVSSISGEARKYVAVAVEKGLVAGYDDRTFRGQSTITRAEATAMLWRAYQYGNDNKEFDLNNASDWIYGDNTNDTSNTVSTPKPIETPKPTKTPKPTPTLKPTATPEPEPTEESERPYVVDTITKANILGGSWGMQEDNDGNFYYYDTNKNKVYQVDVNSEDVEEIFDVSDLELRFDDRFDYEVGEDEVYESNDPKNPDNIIEHYKDFVVSGFYYNKSNDRIVLKGTFKTLTDWYGLGDKSVKHEVYIDITSGKPIICNENVLDDMIVLTNTYRYQDGPDVPWGEPDYAYRTGYKYSIEDGNKIYIFSNEEYTWDYPRNDRSKYIWIGSRYHSSLSAYNYNTNTRELLRGEMTGSYVGLKDNKLYLWSASSGEIITCSTNTKLDKLPINTIEDVDVLDKKIVPRYGGDNFRQIFINDNENIIFYDEDNSAIRIIKER